MDGRHLAGGDDDMIRVVHGHQVRCERCDGLAGFWRVFADGRFVGLVEFDVAGWHTLPVRTPGCSCGPVCHAPTVGLAVETLIAETIDHQETL